MRFFQHILPLLQDVDSVFNCQAIDSHSIPLLYKFMESTDIDVWTHNPIQNANVTLRITSLVHQQFIQKHFNCFVLIENVHEWLMKEEEKHTLYLNANNAFRADKSELEFFKNYQRLESIVEQIYEWKQQFPLLVRMNESIGRSIEERDIPMIHITNLNHHGPKKAIWFNGGQHAREWISTATVLYLAYKFLHLSQDPLISKYLNETDIYITPVMNPDGYEYTHTKDRLWRKNRRRNWDGSHGVDLNRNW